LLSRLKQLDTELLKPDLWNDPSSASKLSRERGRLAGRVSAVKDMESELMEHIGMAELAREERDSQVEAVSCIPIP
jgi:peptide chain release factor 2